MPNNTEVPKIGLCEQYVQWSWVCLAGFGQNRAIVRPRAASEKELGWRTLKYIFRVYGGIARFFGARTSNHNGRPPNRNYVLLKSRNYLLNFLISDLVISYLLSAGSRKFLLKYSFSAQFAAASILLPGAAAPLPKYGPARVYCCYLVHFTFLSSVTLELCWRRWRFI